MNRVDQSELLKFPRTTDRKQTDNRQTYCKLDSRSGPIFHIGPDKNTILSVGSPFLLDIGEAVLYAVEHANGEVPSKGEVRLSLKPGYMK